jgi:hypothetical protein
MPGAAGAAPGAPERAHSVAHRRCVAVVQVAFIGDAVEGEQDHLVGVTPVYVVLDQGDGPSRHVYAPPHAGFSLLTKACGLR